MALTMSSWIVIRKIGCTLILLLVLSAQAIDYEIDRHDVISTNLNSNLILTSRDFLEQLNFVEHKESYALQEGTEHLLYFGALLRVRILDTFGSLLYNYYDDFSIAEVETLHKVYREIFERRYDIFNLIPDILKNPDTRPSTICAGIYAHAESCLRSSANMCRRIRRQHDLPHPDDLDTPALNITYLVYRSSKISRQYPRGFSLAELLKLLQKEVLTITPGLLSGLLFNVRYDSFDDDVRLAEREIVRYFREVAQSTETSVALPIAKLKKFHTVNSFLKYYISMHAETFPDDDLKRHAFLIAKRIADDVGAIDENIHLLGNVYENQTIHVEYLFDLVLPDDLLDNDVVEAKRYLVKKLDEFHVVERYLKVQKYQHTTPAQLTMEITRQLKDIDFAKNIATSLRMHARFWHKSRMIESLDELLELFDAYENLRQVPRYFDMMQKIDRIKETLWDMKDVPVEILCNAPRACLRIGLQSVLHCKFVSPEIKELIRDFLKLSDVCVVPEYAIQESRRSVDIPFMISKMRLSTKTATAGTTWTTAETETTKTEPTFVGEITTKPSTTEDYDQSETTESSESEESTESTESTESVEISNETTEEVSIESEMSAEESTEFMSATATLRTTEPTFTIRERQEETTTTEMSTVDTTTTTIPTTTTTLSTTLATTTILPTTTTTRLFTTTTTTSPTTSPATTITYERTLPTTITMTSPTTSTSRTLPTTSTTLSSTTTTTSPTTNTTTSPITTIEIPTVNMEMKLKRSKIVTNMPMLYGDDDVTKTSQSLTSTTTPIPTKSCESNECTNEPNSGETSEHVETTTTLLSTTQSLTSTTTPTTQTSSLETIRTTSLELDSSTTHQDFVISETTITPTELSETSVTKGDDCTRTSCSEGCKSKSENIETSEKSCETSCDSVLEDCDEDDSTLDNVSEKMKNHTVRCPKIRCDSSEISSECEAEIDKSCECVSKEERSAGCVTLCSSDVGSSSSCEGEQDDCSTSEMPKIDLKFERTRKHGLCEIRDPHHQRQMNRLAKMRAISAAAATSRADVLRSRTLRRRDQIVTKKLYDLLTARLPRSKNEKFSGITEYLLKDPLNKLNKIEGGSRKRRKQREQTYRLRRWLARKLGRKLTGRTSMHRSKTPLRQIERISIERHKID